MKFICIATCLILLVACQEKAPVLHVPTEQHAFALAIHGGAGALRKGEYSPDEEALFHAKLKEAAELGYTMLSRGDSATDVVVAVISLLEDAPIFNAGKGSVISADGKIRMDASIMHGGTLDAGSVTNVQHLRNPITAARAIMDNSKYIMLSGEGAETFAKKYNIPITEPAYFYTPHQVERWKKLKTAEEKPYIKYVDSLLGDQDAVTSLLPVENAFGTVGCVVKDAYGNLAAGTSTGGLMNKQFDRIGDSPIIGAGTYANNHTCAVSCTGTGEDFIKTVAAKSISDLMEFGHMSIEDATYTLIHEQFKRIKGDGGLVAVDHQGNISCQYNSDGMFRAFVYDSGEIITAIY